MVCCVKVHRYAGLPSNVFSACSNSCAMFVMQHICSVILHETAVQCSAAQGEHFLLWVCVFVTTAVFPALVLGREEALAPAVPC